MWIDAVQQPGVAHAADFGAVGVVMYDPTASTPSHWNFQPVTGRYNIGEPWGPWGWKE